jgi:hypothetical protein
VSEDVTRDPLLGKLARFTPAAAGLDRDALLFAAGRASAPAARGWKLAAAALALSQAATLAVLLAGPGVSPRGSPAVVTEPPLRGTDRPSSIEPPPASYASLVRRWERGDLPPVPPVADPVPPHPALSVAAGRGAVGVD